MLPTLATTTVTLPDVSGTAWVLIASVVGLVLFVAVHPAVANTAAMVGSIRKPLMVGLALAMAVAVGHSMTTHVTPPAVSTFSAPVPAPDYANPAGGPPQGPSAPIVMAARPLFPDVPPGGYPHGVYTAGNCTWWAAYNRRVPEWAPPVANGDAAYWIDNARHDGIPTSQEPSVGAIVVYRAGPAYSSHGHVAIVVAIGVGAFEVSEMNYDGLNVVDDRGAPWPDANVAGFIPR